MLKKYYLVELSAHNKVQAIRSNCVLTTWFWKRPPLELAYQNCIELGYSVINILSVTCVNKKTANWIKEYINRKPPELKTSESELNRTVESILNGEKSDISNT